MRVAWVVAVVGVVAARPAAACPADVPAAACAAAPAKVALVRCAADASERAGAWTYALVAPLYTPAESIGEAELVSDWSGVVATAPGAPVPPKKKGKPRPPPKPAVQLAATDATIAALSPRLGPAAVTTLAAGARPTLDATHWAIVPADELSPAWKIIAIAGHHPLEPDADASPLTVPLCAHAPPAPLAVRNIDPAALTILAMTGTTAMTRFMSGLLDTKGTTYPAKDVAPWFAGADFVHVSNEVSFVPGCEQKGATMGFCSREKYIELLEAVHANIIELDGSHLADYGTKWIPHTLEMYAARGWRWFGGGHDQLEGQRPLELEHHGNKLAFLGCNMPKTTSHVVWNVPGVAACDLRRMAWQIAELRARGVLPIVSIQHEEVYVHDPPDEIVHDFRHLAAVGAAIVFGSQAHCAHPFEVDHGAFVHYGAGNFFFDQEGPNTRDGTADRFYIHRGRLLAVGHLYTRLEENGRPRPLTDAERAGFLATLAAALKKLPHADPWATPQPVPLGPLRPDSFLIGSRLQMMYVFTPADAATAGDKKLPLVLDLHDGRWRAGPLERLLGRGLPKLLLADPGAQHAFVASPHLETGESWTGARIAAVTAFVASKYAVDPAQVTIRRE